MKRLYLAGIALLLLVMLPAPGLAGVVIVEQLPLQYETRTITYQGVRSREELSSGYVALMLPDENRMVELYSSRSFEEKPLTAALGKLAGVQQAMAHDARLLDEQLKVGKGKRETIAGLECTYYRFDWKARVKTSRGERTYALRINQCISHAPAALEARKAAFRHIQAMAGRFGKVLRPEAGEMWLFDIGRMMFGIPARKLMMVQARIGGFPLSSDKEVDFGGMLAEPMLRAAMRQQAREDSEPVNEAELDREMQDIQRGMARMKTPEFQAQMREAMREMQNPEVQAQLRQFLGPERMRSMQSMMEGMAKSQGPAASLAEGKLRIRTVLKSIRVTDVAPERMRVPEDYVWKAPVFATSENREADIRDGTGALTKEEVARLTAEAKGAVPPAGAPASYERTPRDVQPWLAFEREWHGVPYRWGGTTKAGVDCSGLTQNAYRAVPGITIPRTTGQQMRAGRRVSLRDVRAGDLVFFDTGFRHVGVYLAQNKFFHASSSKGVTISSLASSYWSRAFRMVVRIPR